MPAVRLKGLSASSWPPKHSMESSFQRDEDEIKNSLTATYEPVGSTSEVEKVLPISTKISLQRETAILIAHGFKRGSSASSIFNLNHLLLRRSNIG